MYRITLSSSERKDHTYSVIIRVYCKGPRGTKRKDKRITVKTLPSCSKKDWNFDAEQYRKSFKKNNSLYNNMILKLKEKCEKIYQSLLKSSTSPSAEAFVEYYHNYDLFKSQLYVLGAIQYKINTLKETNKWGTVKVYNDTFTRWKSFIELEYKGIDIPIIKLSPTHLKRFNTFLLKGKGSGGVELRVRTLKTCFLMACNNNIIPEDTSSPFKKFSPISTDKISKAQSPLSKEQWTKLKNYTPESEYRAFWKDVFMMMVYAQGINLKDLILLKPSNIIDVLDSNGDKVQAIRYIRSKTKRTRKNTFIEIYYSEELKTLVEKYHKPNHKYLVPIIDMNIKGGTIPKEDSEEWFKILVNCRVAFNFQLRMVAKDLGITKKFSNYAARHTFASLLFWGGVDIRIISQALGHKTHAMTHEYLSKLDLITMKNNIKNIL